MQSPIQKSRRARYRVIDGKSSIELKLRTPRQLFDERDPAPFRDRDLDDDAARYILASFREIAEPDSVKLSLYFESLGELSRRPRVIERAIHAFFSFEAEIKRRELRDMVRTGLISLGIGLTFLFTCTAFSHTLQDESATLWRSMIKEGLNLMGWVSMWKPISIFLYEWWPIRDELNTFNRLSEIEVEILPLSPGETRHLVDEPSLPGTGWKETSTM